MVAMAALKEYSLTLYSRQDPRVYLHQVHELQW
jgi:hypothetical protein